MTPREGSLHSLAGHGSARSSPTTKISYDSSPEMVVFPPLEVR